MEDRLLQDANYKLFCHKQRIRGDIFILFSDSFLVI